METLLQSDAYFHEQMFTMCKSLSSFPILDVSVEILYKRLSERCQDCCEIDNRGKEGRGIILEYVNELSITSHVHIETK